MSVETFPLEGTKLTPLREAVRICPGTADDCGDEIDSPDPNQELCPSCQREEDEMYHRRMLDAEGYDDFLAYPHLLDVD